MKVCIYDAAEKSATGWSWAVGAKLFLWSFDRVVGVRSIQESIKALSDCTKPITELQLWGHGAPGAPYIAGRAVDQFVMEAWAVYLAEVRLVWFRSRSVFFGGKGELFAMAWAKQFRGFSCIVAGHTHVVGPWQSGLYTLQHGQAPSWPKYDGDPAALKSGRKQPRTIACTRMSVPKGW